MQQIRLLFFAILGIKLILIFLFTSDYPEVLFLPFIKQAIQNFPADPWKLAIDLGQVDAFPYHPLLFYFLFLWELPLVLMGLPDEFLRIWLGMANFLPDFLNLFLLRSWFSKRPLALLGVYFFSPIILYSIYMHGQLDLFSNSIMLLAVFFLLRKNNFKGTGISLALAVSIKFHVVVAFPIFLFYIYRKNKAELISFIFSFFFTFLIVSLPWYISPYFWKAVLLNSKQELLFQTIYKIGAYNLLIPILSILLVYFKFFTYKRVSSDLLMTWLAILFSVFVLTIPPAPAWYIWILPFLTYFYLKFVNRVKYILYLGGLLQLSFLLFFFFSWRGDYIDLKILNIPLLYKIENQKLNGILFTLLNTALIVNLYAIYQLALKSNAIYNHLRGILIGIGGDSGVGKSTLLHSLAKVLGSSVTLLEGDGDHRWERGHKNYEKFTHLNPRANYLERQAENLYRLKKGEVIYRPDYDHSTGKFTEPKPVVPSQFILISGLHTFYLPKMRKIIDVKIFLNTEEKLRKHWKILRDTKKRGYTIEKILKQIQDRELDSQKYIQPQKEYADICIEYFSLNGFALGEEVEIHIGLRLILLSEFSLESLAFELEEKNLLYEWNYVEDLNRQYFIFHNPIPVFELEILKEKYFSELVGELFPAVLEWDTTDYLGTIQFFTLLTIYQKIKNLNSL